MSITISIDIQLGLPDITSGLMISWFRVLPGSIIIVDIDNYQFNLKDCQDVTFTISLCIVVFLSISLFLYLSAYISPPSHIY